MHSHSVVQLIDYSYVQPGFSAQVLVPSSTERPFDVKWQNFGDFAFDRQQEIESEPSKNDRFSTSFESPTRASTPCRAGA